MTDRLRQKLMNLADSPNLVQDMLTMLTPLRLMMWFTILNVGLGLVLAIGLFAAATSSGEFSRAAGIMGMGQYLGWLIMMTLGGAMTLFIPLRTSGLIITPRFSRYMDQVVLSGISPTRYFFGRLLGVNAFALMLILTTIPYFIFALSLGGLKFTYLIGSLIALMFYANFLGIVTLAFSLIQYELISTIVVTVLFGWIYAGGIIPILPFFALVTPSRLFMIPFIEANGWVANNFPVQLAGISFAIPSYALFLLSYTLILTFLVCCLVAGPLHCIGLPNSTFGEVIMTGDSKKRSLFRKHGNLRRKSELCFLYENSSPWLRNYEIPIRWGRNLLALVTVFLVPMLSCHIFSDSFNGQEFFITTYVAVVGALVMAGIIFSHDAGTEKTPVRFKSIRVSAGAVSTVCFSGFMIFVVCSGFLPPLVRYALQTDDWLRSSKGGEVFFRGLLTIPITMIFVVQIYSVFRMMLMHRWGYGVPTFLTVVLIGVLCILPILPYSTFNSLPHVYQVKYGWIEPALALLTYVSPVTHVMTIISWPISKNGPDIVYQLRVVGGAITVSFHSLLAIFFVIKATRTHQRMRPFNQ